MSKINETNYPRRTQANYADTDMLVIQAAGGNTYTTRIEDLREDCQETLAPALNTMRENLATVEGSTASKAYAKGDFLVFGGRLCKAKTSIASGATLVLDTNIELDSVGDELSSISSDLASMIQTMTATIPSTVSGISQTALPTGLTGTNCMVIDAKINIVAGYQYTLAAIRRLGGDVVLNGSNLIITTDADSASEILGKDITVALYKYA